mgnify:CR=1 FL=1
MELLFMDPVFKEAIWGGTKLRDVFDYEIPSVQPASAGRSADMPTE